MTDLHARRLVEPGTLYQEIATGRLVVADGVLVGLVAFYDADRLRVVEHARLDEFHARFAVADSL